MTKENIRKAVYDLILEIYECEGLNSTERTLGEIMGIMSMASEMENLATPETPDHDGCKNCKWDWKTKEEHPCSGCKQNYTDKWEKRDE